MQHADYLLLKQVLSVAEGAEFGLLFLVLQFFLGRTEVEDEILKREDDPLQRKWHRPWGLVLPAQRVQTPGTTQTRFISPTTFHLLDQYMVTIKHAGFINILLLTWWTAWRGPSCCKSYEQPETLQFGNGTQLEHHPYDPPGAEWPRGMDNKLHTISIYDWTGVITAAQL